jgi:hypothetical protein
LVASGGADKEAAAWAASALAAWLRAGGAVSLPRCLGLAGTPRKVQLLLRDQWICEAARHVPGDTPWQKACALAAEIRHFERLWECWRNGKLPPQHARPVEQALFFARQHGELPKSSRQLRNVLTR